MSEAFVTPVRRYTDQLCRINDTRHAGVHGDHVPCLLASGSLRWPARVEARTTGGWYGTSTTTLSGAVSYGYGEGEDRDVKSLRELRAYGSDTYLLQLPLFVKIHGAPAALALVNLSAGIPSKSADSGSMHVIMRHMPAYAQ